MKPLYLLAVVGTARPNGVVSILAKKFSKVRVHLVIKQNL